MDIKMDNALGQGMSPEIMALMEKLNERRALGGIPERTPALKADTSISIAPTVDPNLPDQSSGIDPDLMRQLEAEAQMAQQQVPMNDEASNSVPGNDSISATVPGNDSLSKTVPSNDRGEQYMLDLLRAKMAKKQQ